EHARVEHILIQLNAGASAPKSSTKTKAFQLRLDTLYNRFHEKEINQKELLSGLSLKQYSLWIKAMNSSF
ncbi:unnamed protein product, partial [Rotaria magnacalcarata]